MSLCMHTGIKNKDITPQCPFIFEERMTETDHIFPGKSHRIFHVFHVIFLLVSPEHVFSFFKQHNFQRLEMPEEPSG